MRVSSLPAGAVAGLVVVAVAIAGTIVLKLVRRPEVTPSIRGMEVARELGCFACHGPDGTGGVATIGDPGGYVPGWDHATAVMYIQNEPEIREWILYGTRAAEAQAAGAAAPGRPDPHARLPGSAVDRELDDLVAYFRAVSWWTPDIPEAARAGRNIAARMGCFGCHGPSGMGGVANPGSLTGYIPPWDGEDFGELVRNEDELREWIMDGRIRRLWDNPLARRYFLESQKTQMPAYRGTFQR